MRKRPKLHDMSARAFAHRLADIIGCDVTMIGNSYHVGAHFLVREPIVGWPIVILCKHTDDLKRMTRKEALRYAKLLRPI